MLLDTLVHLAIDLVSALAFLIELHSIPATNNALQCRALEHDSALVKLVLHKAFDTTDSALFSVE